LAKVASELKRDGYFLLGEQVIGDYKDEAERKLAAIELGSALLAHCVNADAPNAVLKAACDVFESDLFESGEFKSSRHGLLTLLAPYFQVECEYHIWPGSPHLFGDFLFVCKHKGLG
jgi:hypothetical protein